MQYIKTNGGDTYIEFDKDKLTSRVIVKSEIEKQLADAEERLAAIPNDPTDEELLAWAKQNYPSVNYLSERFALEKIIEQSKTVLSNLK